MDLSDEEFLKQVYARNDLLCPWAVSGPMGRARTKFRIFVFWEMSKIQDFRRTQNPGFSPGFIHDATRFSGRQMTSYSAPASPRPLPDKVFHTDRPPAPLCVEIGPGPNSGFFGWPGLFISRVPLIFLFPESDQRRVLVVYVFCWSHIARPG